MSIRAIDLVLRALLPDPLSKLVALRLADFAGHDGSGIRPSVARVMRDTGLCERSVHRRLKVLRRLGVLQRVPKPRGSSVNHYRMDFEVLRQLAGASAEERPGDASDLAGGQCEAAPVTPNPSVNRHLTVSVTTPATADDLQDRLIAAAGQSIDEGRIRKSSLAPALAWLSDRLDLEHDILPAIIAKAHTLSAGQVKSWLFFDGPVREWRAHQGAAPRAVRNAPAAARRPETFSETDWQCRLAHHEATGRWHDAWGPEPGEAGCLVPRYLLSKRSRA